jgi:hypothetical protein
MSDGRGPDSEGSGPPSPGGDPPPDASSSSAPEHRPPSFDWLLFFGVVVLTAICYGIGQLIWIRFHPTLESMWSMFISYAGAKPSFTVDHSEQKSPQIILRSAPAPVATSITATNSTVAITTDTTTTTTTATTIATSDIGILEKTPSQPDSIALDVPVYEDPISTIVPKGPIINQALVALDSILAPYGIDFMNAFAVSIVLFGVLFLLKKSAELDETQNDALAAQAHDNKKKRTLVRQGVITPRSSGRKRLHRLQSARSEQKIFEDVIMETSREDTSKELSEQASTRKFQAQSLL